MALRPLNSTDALLVIDMQLDFLPGGALEVKGGDEIIPGINALAAHFDHVILTQDWHPRGHISFASTHHKQPFTDTIQAPYGAQTLWPDHCIQGTRGAELHPGSCERAFGKISTATPLSPRTTASPPPASPAIFASAASHVSSLPALPTTSASASQPSPPPAWDSNPS